MSTNLRVWFVGDLKVREENDGVTLSWQGLEYSEIPVTQERITRLMREFVKFKPDDPSLAIKYALTDFDDGMYFLADWREGEYSKEYLAWMKGLFLNEI